MPPSERICKILWRNLFKEKNKARVIFQVFILFPSPHSSQFITAAQSLAKAPRSLSSWTMPMRLTVCLYCGIKYVETLCLLEPVSPFRSGLIVTPHLSCRNACTIIAYCFMFPKDGAIQSLIISQNALQDGETVSTILLRGWNWSVTKPYSSKRSRHEQVSV